MSSSPHDEQAQNGDLPEKLNREIDRRTFFSISALLGLGFAAGCSDVSRNFTGIASGPSMLESVPDGNAAALDLFNRSPTAQQLGQWLQRHGLRQEPARALLFDVPAASELPTGVTAEDRPSLVGESAYRTFQNDSFARANFTGDQMASISSVARVQMASDIGSVLQHGGVLAAACCCCCCCSLCCCSCNNGDNGGNHSAAAFRASAVPFGDPTIVYGGPVRDYFRGTVGVQDNGEAVAILAAVTNDADFTAHQITIGLFDHQTGAVNEYRFTPSELDELGPEALARRLFPAA